MTTSPERIRALLAAGNVVLGPMAGITDAVYRGICKRMGAGLTYTEMISVKGLHYNPDSLVSERLLTFSPDETPCAVQLFGAEPDLMAEQAARICERYGDDIALIDVNMGCPVTKVVAKGAGSALMRTPELAGEIVGAIAAACPVPVTAKFRKGWESAEENAVEFARAMEEAGASAVTVHGRNRSQFYRGKADWDVIAAVKEAVTIPVIGSGDVFSAEDAKAMLERTGVDGVMVARGAQGNPWIFRQARAALDGTAPPAPPDGLARVDVAREHAAALREMVGEEACRRMRKHVAWYVFGLPGATFVRERAFRAPTYADLDAVLLEYRAYLEQRAERQQAR